MKIKLNINEIDALYRLVEFHGEKTNENEILKRKLKAAGQKAWEELE